MVNRNKMKIYFAGSIRGGREDQGIYFSIIEILKKYGEVLTEHVSDPNLSSYGEKLSTDVIYKRDVSLISESDIIIAEVTVPSLGVGYEIGKAESLNKKIICLHRDISGKSLSAMISGNENVETHKYEKVEDLYEYFKNKLEV